MRGFLIEKIRTKVFGNFIIGAYGFKFIFVC
jgi:hypothetical protein